MGNVLGGGSAPPQRDTAAEDARRKAEEDARREKEELERKQKEEASARRRGLRGRSALLSKEGGELGFPSTLG